MKYKCLAFAVFFAMLPLVAAKMVHFTVCGKPKGELISLDITPCDQEPCIMKRGSNVTLLMTFKSKEEATKLKMKATGRVGPISLPVSIPNPDGCKGHGVHCPLQENVQYEMKLVQTVDPHFPTFPITLMMELKDQDDKDVLCAEVKLKIV